MGEWADGVGLLAPVGRGRRVNSQRVGKVNPGPDGSGMRDESQAANLEAAAEHDAGVTKQLVRVGLLRRADRDLCNFQLLAHPRCPSPSFLVSKARRCNP